jgi:hypothetical protein
MNRFNLLTISIEEKMNGLYGSFPAMQREEILPQFVEYFARRRGDRSQLSLRFPAFLHSQPPGRKAVFASSFGREENS